MTHWIRTISEWGIEPETPYTQAQHYRLTNVLLLFMVFASFLETGACFLAGAYEAGMINSTAPLTFGTGLFLMKKGYTVFARVLVVSISYTAGYAMITVLGPETFFQFIFLFASAFALAFFSTEEKWLLFGALAAPLLCFIGLEVTDYAPVFGLKRVQLSPIQVMWMRIMSVIVIWLLMVFHFFYFVRDRRKAQEQLINSTKMVALGRMAAGIAHEVNNPLQIIMAHAERLKSITRKPGVPIEQVDAVSDQIQSVAMRIASINKGLLALSRNAANDPLAVVSVKSIVKLALDYSRAHLESHQVELRLSEVSAQWSVVGRETQLSEVLLNVLSNAYDAVSESTQARWIGIEATAGTEWIEISVTDSGPGVEPKFRHRIFEPFFTTKPIGKGTGLGLSVSQGIMQAHGGQIVFDAKSERTRFVIRIPRGQDIEAADRAFPASKEQNVDGKEHTAS